MATSYCKFIIIMNRNVNNLICNPKGVETHRLRATAIEHESLSQNKNKWRSCIPGRRDFPHDELGVLISERGLE